MDITGNQVKAEAKVKEKLDLNLNLSLFANPFSNPR